MNLPEYLVVLPDPRTMSSSTFSIQDALCCCSSKSSAKKIDRDAVLPFILLPLLLLLASLSIITTIIVMVATGMAVLYVYSRPQQKNRSPFFFYWTVSSWVYLLILYMIEVVGTLTVTVVENVIVLVLMACTLYFFYKMKHVADVELGMARGKEYSPMLTSDSKYCHICQIEVNERFFHSIWWNCCIFRPNYPYFVAGHFFAFVTLLFSTNIGLTTVCEIFTLHGTFMVPNDCSMVYDDFDSSLTFATCIYAAGYTLVVAFVLLRQLFVFIPKYSEPQWRRLRNVLNV